MKTTELVTPAVIVAHATPVPTNVPVVAVPVQQSVIHQVSPQKVLGTTTTDLVYTSTLQKCWAWVLILMCIDIVFSIFVYFDGVSAGTILFGLVGVYVAWVPFAKKVQNADLVEGNCRTQLYIIIISWILSGLCRLGSISTWLTFINDPDAGFGQVLLVIVLAPFIYAMIAYSVLVFFPVLLYCTYTAYKALDEHPSEPERSNIMINNNIVNNNCPIAQNV